jgi:hypothetical protein
MERKERDGKESDMGEAKVREEGEPRYLKDAQTTKSELNGKCVADLSGTEKLSITLGHSAPTSASSRQENRSAHHLGSLQPGESCHTCPLL